MFRKIIAVIAAIAALATPVAMAQDAVVINTAYVSADAQLVKQYQYQGETCYDNLLGGVTDDRICIQGIVYTRDETEIKISVFVDGK